MKVFKDNDLQLFIGRLLRGGVVIAMTIVILGLFLFMLNHSGDAIQHAEFRPDVFNPAELFSLLKEGNSYAIMTFGVIVLIATPIARVLFTMIGFWLEGDKLYTFIAFLVLCIIILSMIYGAVE